MPETEIAIVERIEPSLPRGEAVGVAVRDLDLSAFCFQITENGLRPLGAPTFEQWMQCGDVLRTYHGYLMREATLIQFAIGDWLNFGERTYGEQYSAAVEATGYSWKTLANFKYVSAAVETSRREESLSYSHHAAVAALPPAKQSEYLETAAREQLSVRALREQVNAERGTPPDDDEVTCPNCGARFIP